MSLPTVECFRQMDIIDQLTALYEAILNIGDSFDPDALAYFTRAGVIDETAKVQINSFITGAKEGGYWDLLDEAWLLRSSQNAGSGTTAFALKSDANNGTLVNGPSWGVDGIVFVSASSQSITTTFTSSSPAVSILSTSSHPSGADMATISQDDIGATRRVALVCNPGSPSMYGYVFNPGFVIVATGYSAGQFRSLIMRAGASMMNVDNFTDPEGSGTPGNIAAGAGLPITIGARADGAFFCNGTITHAMHFGTVLSDAQKAHLYANIKATIGSGLSLP